MLGIINKAGKLEIGMDNIIRSIKNGKCQLVICAEDIGFHSFKKIKKACDKYDIKLIKWGNKKTLAQSLGKRNVGLLAITDQNFSLNLTIIIEEGNKNGGGIDGKN